MAGNRFLDENLRRTEDDVRAKVREADVQNYDQVLAVVLETTGDISVVHGDTELTSRLPQSLCDALTSTAGLRLTQDRLGSGDPHSGSRVASGRRTSASSRKP